MITYAEKHTLEIEYGVGQLLNYEKEELLADHKVCEYELDSMLIEDVVEILNRLKESGAERVCFGTHADHGSYFFLGTKRVEI